MTYQRIALAIVLLVFVTAVFAKDPPEILKGYSITASAECRFDGKGKLDDNGKTVLDCFVAINPKKLDSFLVLVNDQKGKPYKIIEVDIVTHEEKLLWVSGAAT